MLVSSISRGCADGAVVDQRAGQAVDRVAAVVLGDRQDLAGPLRAASTIRLQPRTVTRQRLLAQEVQAGFEAGRRRRDGASRRRW